MVAPRSHVGCSTSRFCFWFLESFFGNGWMEWILLAQTRNVGLVTKILTAEYLSAWQVLGNLKIAEVLRDYVASNPQREQICLFLSSWLGISKWTQVPGFNVANAKSTVRHRIDSLTAKLLQQGYRYHKLRKTFSKFYRRHYELVSKFNVGLKTLLHQGLSEPEFYGDLVYKFKKIVGRVDFCDQFRKIIVRYKRIGYNINIMRQSACLVFNPITVNNFASLFNCTPVGRASDSMMAPT